MKDKSSFFPINTILIINVGGILLVLLSFTGLFNSIYSISDFLTNKIKGDFRGTLNNLNESISVISNVYSVKNERDELKERILDLEEENTKLKTYQEQIKVLEDQLGSSFSRSFDLIAAQIIYLDPKEEGRATIDRGNLDGVSAGDVIVVKGSALGEVISVNERSSGIMLISSPQSKIPVISQKNSTRGIMTGEFGGKVIVENIVQTDTLENQESFVTLGINSNYPAGLFVGRVTQISEIQAETKKTVVLDTELNFQTLRYVFILKTEKE